MSHIKVGLNAVLNEDGSVSCELECRHQRAVVIFTGTDVLLDIPELPAAKSVESLGDTNVVPPPGVGTFPPQPWPDLTPGA